MSDERTCGASDEGRARPNALWAPIAFGDLIDRITILEIKTERIADPVRNGHIRTELRALQDVLASIEALPTGAVQLRARLRSLNEVLWAVEDAIRVLETAKDFGAQFVELARRVYKTNDLRAGVKKELNALVGSPITEEKSYRS